MASDLEKKISFELYYSMCRDCPNAKECHDSCESCEEYEEELEKELKKAGVYK